ncbi:hypothetical protein TFLX_04142 [Thermoflexales bacterium]|nr:hypothetical protein TFLX_04142 [Thermoflexales bacterium]
MDYRDTLEEIELRGGLTTGFDAALRFMIETCRKMPLHSDVRECLDVAVRYLEHDASFEDLETARVRCWQLIKGRDSDLRDPNVASIRSVICTLYPHDPRNDLFMTLDVFEDFAIAAGINPADLLLGLRAAFGNAA